MVRAFLGGTVVLLFVALTLFGGEGEEEGSARILEFGQGTFRVTDLKVVADPQDDQVVAWVNVQETREFWICSNEWVRPGSTPSSNLRFDHVSPPYPTYGEFLDWVRTQLGGDLSIKEEFEHTVYRLR